MDIFVPQRAAQRFTKYWEQRHELFGPDKYLSPMTISESLSDGDLAALRAGVFHHLPRRESSGRPLLLLNYSCDTREGYSLENLVRVSVQDEFPEDTPTHSSTYFFLIATGFLVFI